MKFSAVITDAKVRSEVAIKVTTLPADGSYQITIQKVSTNRSLNQNNLYWQWLTIISDNTGNDVNELHTYFKTVFLGMKTTEVFGRVIETVSDSHTLSVSEFANYMTQVQAFAASELGIELPTA